MKSKQATEVSTHLLFFPDRIGSSTSAFSMLLIDRSSGKPLTIEKELDHKWLKKHLNGYSKEYDDAIQSLSEDGWKALHTQTHAQYIKNKSGIAWDKAFAKVSRNHVMSQLTLLWPFLNQHGCYHKIEHKQSQKRVTTKAHFSGEEPVLRFKLRRKKDNILDLQTFIGINGQYYLLSELERYACLFRHEQTYYKLSQQDWDTISWLETGIMEQYAKHEQLVWSNVIKRLKLDYEVDTATAIQDIVISTTPVNCVLLSELNNNTLMITPRWNYEGIVLDMPFQPLSSTIKHGKCYTINRDEHTESGFLEYIRSFHPSFHQQSNFFFLSFAEAEKKLWFFKFYQQLLEDGVEIIGMEMLQHFRFSPYIPETHIEILSEDENYYTFTLSVKFGEWEVRLTQLQQMLLAGQHTIVLPDQSLAVLPDEWQEQYAQLVRHAKIKGNLLTVSKWLGMSMQEGVIREQFLKNVSLEWRQKWQSWQQAQAPVYPAPKSLQCTMRPYQHKGYEWISLLAEIGAGACLADDMGLGKTMQTIAYICKVVEEQPEAKILVVCPLSLVFNWHNEFRKFAPDIKTYMYHGANRNWAAFLSSDANILLASYGTLRADVELIRNMVWEVVVADESHNVKNSVAQTTQAMMMLQAHMRVALTGTPIMNNTMELFAQMDFLVPGLLGTQSFFKKEYAQPIDQCANEDKREALKRLVHPFMLKRNKQQVAADLPEKTEEVIWIQMNERQKAIYEEIKAQVGSSLFLDIKEKGLKHSTMNILQAIMKLRQICASPKLLADYRAEDCSAKIQFLKEQFELLRGKKLLVFSQYREMLQEIAHACRDLELDYLLFDGSTSLPERAAIVEQFQSPDTDKNILIMSLKAGNAGLNLTAAEYVFLVDPWWNHAVEQQAIDRTHRIGQTKHIFAYQLLCQDSIEEKIRNLQQQKASLAQDLVQAEDGFVKNLSEDDIKYLFS